VYSEWLSFFIRRRAATISSRRLWLLILFLLAISSEVAHAAILRLSWQDTATNESGFKIERLNGSNYVEIASVAANIQSYTDSNLAAGVNYCYRVRAFNAVGVSAPTNAACVTTPNEPIPLPPTPSSPPPSTTPTPTTPIVTSPPAVGKQWSDYLVSLRMRSADNDSLGVLFRYQDADNYYRFSWSAEGKSRRLEKRVNGVFQLLARDNAPYRTGRNYALQISARGNQLIVIVDGKTIFSVTDTSFRQGTIGLYSFRNAGSRFDDVKVRDLITGNLLLADSFTDGNHVGWTIIDEGNDGGPSVWSVADGVLRQSSNIGSTVDNGNLGTYALYTRGSWADYRVTLKLSSSDNDRLGVMFRFQDSENYYRFSWDQGSPGRRLSKHENGVYKILAEDAIPYVSNQIYSIEIIAQGNSLKVKIDGKAVFSVTDSSFAAGAIALYSSYNQGSIFDDVLVEALTPQTILLWDDFRAGNLPGWKAFDEPGTNLGPSEWSSASGALIQRSNIGSDSVGHPGTYLLY
jgi:hypothetical protein